MAEGKGTPISEQEKEPDKRPPWWKRLWEWTEFGKKSGWDLLQLLIVPLALAVIGFWFTAQQDARQQQVENQRADAERELAEQRVQDEALQAYLDQMSSLLLAENGLRESKEGSEVRTLARARTITVLERLDPDRKTALIQFLVEANLVQSVEGRAPIITLSGANLVEADLSGADLRGANLVEADLRDADLRGANFAGAQLERANFHRTDLRWANLVEADLSGTDLRDANLRWANLFGGDLFGADLRDADLRWAGLSEAGGVTKMMLEQQAESFDGAIMLDGALYPGQYAMREFEPAISFEVGEGWGLVALETPDSLFIGHPKGRLAFTNPHQIFDPSNSSEPKELPAPENATEWVSWLQSHPDLDTSKPLRVSVGGVSGMRIDVTASSTPENYPQDLCGGLPCVPLSPLSNKKGILVYEGFKDQFVIVDVGGETVLIDVYAPAEKFDEFLSEARKVLDTVEWEGG